ncbi:MAG: hypothetical protein KA265_19145 [Piscinibacter sp.]|nr:hypothetical protein [Piscinibacter sp.]
MAHLGDFDASAVIYGKFTTYRPSTGAAYALGGTPALSVYKDNSTTQSTSGVTLTADFDGVTGLNHFAIDTSADGSFYAAGSFFDIVITTGTVDGVSVVGSVVASFTIRKNSALKPTTAGRTLDVSSGGEAGLDWANVGSPTTTLALSGTTISTSQAVASVSGAVGSVTGNVGGSVGSVTGNVGGNVVGSIGSVATGGIVAASFAAGAIDAAAIATDAITSAELAATATAEIATAVRTELATELARIDVATSTRLASASYSAPPSAATIAGAVWDEAISGHLTAGTTGAKLNAAASAGDPWSTALPGAYSAGSAGFLVGTYLDAAISTRLATSGYTAPLSAAGTRTALGLASANLDTQLDALPTATENADALLDRDMGVGADTNSRSPRNALRHIRNKWSVSGTTLTVTKEDDSTTAWTSTLSTNASADPITGSDPA